MSNFKIGDVIKITKNYENFEGIIKNICWKNNIYVSFSNKEIYNKLLINGSQLFCYVKGVCIYCFISNKEKLKVSQNTEILTLFENEFDIELSDIVSMLISL